MIDRAHFLYSVISVHGDFSPMDDFPQDELDNPSFYITPSSSALVALSSLNPPSPILTPSQLTFTWSSGDIPLVLFDDTYTLDGRTLTHTPTTAVSIRNRDSYASSTGTGIRTLGFNRAQVLSHRDSIGSQGDIDSFHSSGSSNTLASVGTFGPRRMNLKSYCDTRPISTGTSVSGISSSALRTVDYERRDTTITRHHTSRSSGGRTLLDDNITLGALTSQASSKTLKGLTPRLSLADNDKTIALSSLRTSLSDDSNTWEHRAHKLPKIPETPSPAASNRTASWIQSHERSSAQKQDHGFPENIPPINRASTDRKQALISPVIPTRRAILTDQDVNLVASSSPQHRRKSTHHVDPKHFPQPKEDFAWIRDITIQCLIDQEGFRTAQPSFKLSGIVHLRSSLEPQTPGPATAQFRPIARQSFHFHHAAFEAPPTLRRVTINDQETHDYVSKQAHLTLKCNGVYVVHGQEISSVDHDGQAQKLSWQFEYLVDDRRVDVSGRVIEGEKIFTPLTFSCSPELLLPAQGKRINIMHVFKKGVAPKLYAEKLQPPGALSGRPESPGKTHGWSLHRRVQSHGTRHKDGHKTMNSRAGIHNRTNSHRTRTAVENVNEDEFGLGHRRASSVGDHSQTANYNSIVLRNRRHDSPIKDTVQPSTLPHPTRHIIPPCRLAELFDSAEFSQPVPASICEPSAFTSLTPRPRSRHAWEGKPEDFSRS